MRLTGERVLGAGRWLALKESVYVTDDGHEVRWESIDRVQSREVVVVCARLVPSGRMILTRQYRPAVNNWVIGFPAGIVDHGDAAESALKELHEETGYTGVIRRMGPRLLSNAAIISDHLRLVYAEIDESDHTNRAPSQSLEPAEEIEVRLVAPADVRAFIARRQELGDEIGSGAWYLLGFWDEFGMAAANPAGPSG